MVLLPAVPVAVISALLGLEEGYAAWSRWAYLLFFLYGFALAADERFREAMRRDALPAAVLGLVLFLIGLPGLPDRRRLRAVHRHDRTRDRRSHVVRHDGMVLARRDPGTPRPPPPPGSGHAELPPNAGSGPHRRTTRPSNGTRRPPPPRRSLGRGRRLYGYLAIAALPLYILHQPIVVAVAYGVVGWDAPIVVKYTVIVAVSLALTVAAYDLLVRRTRVTRFLFGMRGQAERPRAAATGPVGEQPAGTGVRPTDG